MSSIFEPGDRVHSAKTHRGETASPDPHETRQDDSLQEHATQLPALAQLREGHAVISLGTAYAADDAAETAALALCGC